MCASEKREGREKDRVNGYDIGKKSKARAERGDRKTEKRYTRGRVWV